MGSLNSFEKNIENTENEADSDYEKEDISNGDVKEKSCSKKKTRPKELRKEEIKRMRPLPFSKSTRKAKKSIEKNWKGTDRKG